MRTVEYVACMKCNKKVDVYFAHGAILVSSCKTCYVGKRRFSKWLRNFFKNKPPRGT
jgi:hypothetical protein